MTRDEAYEKAATEVLVLCQRVDGDDPLLSDSRRIALALAAIAKALLLIGVGR